MSDALRRLRDETREHHTRVERASGLDPSAPNSVVLHRFIERMAGFAPTLVTRLRPALAPWWPADDRWPLVRALEEDMHTLRLAPAPARRYPVVSDESAAWGAAYVLEGAALGRRMLARAFGPSYAHVRYLAGADAESDRWLRFRQAFSERSRVLELDRTVAAARDTFVALEEHFRMPPDGPSDVR